VIKFAKQEQRQWPRVRLSCLVRVRPSQPTGDEFDEVMITLNSSRRGCYFTTDSARYRKHLRLFVAIPYSDSLGTINRDYIGEVSRVDNFEDGRRGVAINLLMPLSITIQNQVTVSAGDISMKLGQIDPIARNH
jgi:hypothetical protein